MKWKPFVFIAIVRSEGRRNQMNRLKPWIFKRLARLGAVACVLWASALSSPAWEWGTTQHVWTTGFDIFSSPAIGSNGTIYVGSCDSKLYAFNPDGTTQHVWTTGDGIYSSPAIGSDGTIYVGSYDNKLYAFNPDGTTQHVWTTGGPIHYSSPAIGSNGTIYVGDESANNLYAFNPDGTTQHVWTTGDTINSSPAIGSNGTIYVGSCDDNLYAFNPDGTTQHVWTTGADIHSSPAIGSNGTIYVAVDDGNLYEFNPDGTTQHVWAIMSGMDQYSSPAIGSDGTIYVGSCDSNFYAFNPDGTTQYVWKTGGKIDSSPAIGSNGTIYVGSYDNKLYAFNGTGGTLANTPWPKFRQNRLNTGREILSSVLPPTGVSASDGTYIDKVRLAWLSITNATGYQIWRGTSSSSASAGLLGSSTSAEYDDSAASVGIVYYYWVKATNSSAVSAFSGSDSGWRALSVPTGVSASDGTYVDKVRVTWNAVTGAASYCVWRNTSNSTCTATQIVETSSVSYDDTSVTLQVTYYYWVQAKNSIGISGFSSSDTGYVAQAYGLVAVDVTPDSGTWTFTSYPSDYTGPTSGTGDLSSQAAPVGSYTIEFGALTGYTTPASATGTVTTNATTTFSATYAAIDSDNDGLSNLDETNVYGTDPYNPDTDGDRYLDGEEVSAGSDPLDANSYPSGTLSLTAPTTGTVAKRGKSLTVSWTGDSALGTADIYLARGTNFWNLAIGVSCPASSMSGSGKLPSDIAPATNYHVKVKGTGSVDEFGDSAIFTVIRECHGDYDGDGKADLCLYYPPWGMWFVRRSAKGFWYQQFGWDGPTPIPADYDGDGLTDLAVYDPDTGTWYVLTWAWEFYMLTFGWSETIPVPGDYDGDGRIDFAVYYPEEGKWYILTWEGDYLSVQFGWSEADPVPADYDGDGTSDVAVYYEAGGMWYMYMSTDGFSSEALGGSGMEALPDDYDGDGTADLAVYDPEAGTWYFNMSSQGYSSVQFGWEEPTPVSGDYDGDGKADIGLVYGPLGLWYQLMSTEGFAYKLFGWEGPIPLD